MGDAGVVKTYPRCKVNAFVLHTGDYVYLQPLLVGDFMEMGIADGLYVSTEGEKSVRMSGGCGEVIGSPTTP